MSNKKIKNSKQLETIISRCKKEGKRVAFTNGCFDILHPGHISYLEAAKKRCDILVVALNTDLSVRQIKGPARPVMKLKDRQKIIAALEVVDYVTSFSETTPRKLIGQLKPGLVIKGGDWSVKNIVGKNIVNSYGGKAISVKYLKGYSSNSIIQRIKDNL